MTRYQMETCIMLNEHCTYMRKSNYNPYEAFSDQERPIPGVILYFNQVNEKLMQVLPDGSITLWKGEL